MRLDSKFLASVAIFVVVWFVIAYAVSKNVGTALGSAVLVGVVAVGFRALGRSRK